MVLHERAGEPAVVLAASGLTRQASTGWTVRSATSRPWWAPRGDESGDSLQLAALGTTRHWRVVVVGAACAALLDDVDDETSASLLARVWSALQRRPGRMRPRGLDSFGPPLAHTLEAAAADVPGCLGAGLVHLPTGDVESGFLAEEGAGLRLASGASVASALLTTGPQAGDQRAAEEVWALTRRGLFLAFPLGDGIPQALVFACRRATNVGVALAIGRQWRVRVADHAR